MLKWNVYVEDFNARCMRVHNIFDHWSLREDLKKLVKKCGDDRKTFEEELKHHLKYYYWSKCEWEIVLSPWPEWKDFREMKIDVYDQIALNWEQFVNYVWENRKEILKWKPE